MKCLVVAGLVFALALNGSAQFGGGASGYSPQSSRSKAIQRERDKQNLSKEQLPPSSTSTFVEANVLMNVKADEYVAIFGISKEGITVAECNSKMDATVKEFKTELLSLGIPVIDIFVDYINQSKIYEFETKGDVLQEKLAGFVLNKNISIHFKSSAMLDKLTIAAAKLQIYDLIKVDYIVKDVFAVQAKLMQEASKVVKSKIARYESLLGIKLGLPTQVYTEKPAIYYPTQMYDSYVAQESEQILSYPDRQRFTVQSARKSKTFYFNALDADGFDSVINSIITEPVVQFTLYVKVKCDLRRDAKAK
jgi:uncharacterized protein YggE